MSAGATAPALPSVAEKRCNVCGETKPSSGFFRNSHTKSGLSGACKPCHVTQVKRAARLTAAGITHVEVECATCGTKFMQERRRGGKTFFCSDRCQWSKSERHRYYNWGFTPKTFAEAIEAQHNCCAACGESFGDELPYVDHCHANGHIRGLIHRNCNSALGLAEDSPARLIALAAYLVRDALKPGIE